jgi:large subunit ribosomal protein L4
MLKADLYNFEGKKKESVNLPKEYDIKPNLRLLSHAIHVYEDRTHFGLAKAKTRGEVAISTRKIYKQKGTGGARHGAKSAPIFVGGGAAHGPTGIKRVLHLSRSQRNKALFFALNYKASNSRVVFAEGLEKIKRTKDAVNFIDSILKDKAWKNRKNIVVALSEKNAQSLKAFRNIKGVITDYYKNLNAYKIFLANVLIVDKEALEEKLAKNEEKKEKIKEEKAKEVAKSKKVVKKTKTSSSKKTAGSKKAKVIAKNRRR